MTPRELWLSSLEDEWFTRYHSQTLKNTVNFSEWWVDFYGKPDDYGEVNEYWIRCGFALMGWTAAKEVK